MQNSRTFEVCSWTYFTKFYHICKVKTTIARERETAR
uniref:Uncharacterized protein n=1 Tax=Anguilla anguilla TaxID=7936 RepID=A0A0E9PWH9_ANGAN